MYTKALQAKQEAKEDLEPLGERLRRYGAEFAKELYNSSAHFVRALNDPYLAEYIRRQVKSYEALSITELVKQAIEIRRKADSYALAGKIRQEDSSSGQHQSSISKWTDRDPVRVDTDKSAHSGKSTYQPQRQDRKPDAKSETGKTEGGSGITAKPRPYGQTSDRS
jgi:hypothetical protein